MPLRVCASYFCQFIFTLHRSNRTYSFVAKSEFRKKLPSENWCEIFFKWFPVLFTKTKKNVCFTFDDLSWRPISLSVGISGDRHACIATITGRWVIYSAISKSHLGNLEVGVNPSFCQSHTEQIGFRFDCRTKFFVGSSNHHFCFRWELFKLCIGSLNSIFYF